MAGEPSGARGASFQRAQDIWFLDSYSIPWNRANEEDFGKLKYYKWEGRAWASSDADTFFQTQNPDIPLIVFVPGYTSTTKDTVEVGMVMVGRFDPRKPARVVFWNWPALKRYCSLGHDIRVKMPVASASADYLVMLLRRLKSDSKVCLFGFSFGNRIVLDTVQRLGTDRPGGMRIRLVIGSAATDRQFLAHRQRNGRVPELAEKILVFYNPLDRALLFYPLIYGDGSRPTALGLSGAPMCAILPQFRNRLEMVNLFPELGVRHITVAFMGTPAFRKRIGTYFFFDSGKRDPVGSFGSAGIVEEVRFDGFSAEGASGNDDSSVDDSAVEIAKTLYRYRRDGLIERISLAP